MFSCAEPNQVRWACVRVVPGGATQRARARPWVPSGAGAPSSFIPNGAQPAGWTQGAESREKPGPSTGG